MSVKNEGLDVKSFEVSRPRPDFGIMKLGLDIKSEIEDLFESNDIFYILRVIKRIPNLSQMLITAVNITKIGGLIINLSLNSNNNLRRGIPQ